MTAVTDSGSSTSDSNTNDNTPTFTGTAEAGSTVTIFDGATAIGSGVATGGNYSITVSILSDGVHSITAKATDVAGNTSGSSGTLTATIDTQAPTVPGTPDLTAASDLGSSSTDNLTSDTTPTFTGSATTGVTVTLLDGGTPNGTAVAAGSAYSVTSNPALGAGVHVMNATATDTAGNTSAASGTLSITIDTTGPSVTLTSPASGSFTSNQTPTFSGACTTGDGTVTVTLTGPSGTSLTSPCTAGAWSVAPGIARNAGSYTASASQTDTAGNVGTSATVSFTIDLTPPTVTVTTVNGTVRTFPYTTNQTVTTVGGGCGNAAGDIATVTVTITGAGAQSTTSPCTAGAWSYSLTTTLSTDGVSNVTATQVDTAGNGGTSGAKQITVDKTGPTVTLTSPVSGASTNNQTPTFSGACSTGDGTVTVTLTGPSGTSLTSPCTAGAWSVAPGTARNAGAYTVSASQTDVAGNTGTSATVSFTIDITAPTVTLTTVNGTVRPRPYLTNQTVTAVGGPAARRPATWPR